MTSHFNTILTKSFSASEILCQQYGGQDWIIAGKSGNGSGVGLVGRSEGSRLLAGDFLTIHQESGQVTWYSQRGLKIHRSYSFSRPPLQAIFTLFDSFSLTSTSTQLTTSTTPLFSKSGQTESILAVAILVTEFELHIHYESGEQFLILLPIAISALVSTPQGILLQPSITTNQQHAKLIHSTAFFTSSTISQISDCRGNIFADNAFLLLRSPRSVLQSIPTMSWPSSSSQEDDRYQLLAVHYDIICVYHVNKRAIVILQYALTGDSCSSMPHHSTPLWETSVVMEDGVGSSSLFDMNTPALECLDRSGSVYLEGHGRHGASSSNLLSSMASWTSYSSRSGQSKRSALSPTPLGSANSGRSASSTGTMRLSPQSLERGTSATYDSETLQILLGVKPVAGASGGSGGGRLLRGRPRSSPNVANSMIPSAAGQYSRRNGLHDHSSQLLLEEEELMMESMDATLDSSSCARLQVIATLVIDEALLPNHTGDVFSFNAQFSRIGEDRNDGLVLHLLHAETGCYMQFLIPSTASLSKIPTTLSSHLTQHLHPSGGEKRVEMSGFGYLSSFSLPLTVTTTYTQQQDDEKFGSACSLPLAIVLSSSNQNVMEQHEDQQHGVLIGAASCGRIALEQCCVLNLWERYLTPATTDQMTISGKQSRIVSISALSSFLPYLVLRREDGISEVVSIERQSSFDHSICWSSELEQAVLKGMSYCYPLSDRFVLWILQSLWMSELQQGSSNDDEHILKTMTLWLGLLMQIPREAVESYLAGVSSIRNIHPCISSDEYDCLLEQLQQKYSSQELLEIAQVLFHAVLLTWQEVSLRESSSHEDNDGNSSSSSSSVLALTSLLTTLRDFSCFCVGHGHGEGRAWMELQSQLLKVSSSSSITSLPPIMEWIQFILSSFSSSSSSSIPSESLSSKSHAQVGGSEKIRKQQQQNEIIALMETTVKKRLLTTTSLSKTISNPFPVTTLVVLFIQGLTSSLAVANQAITQSSSSPCSLLSHGLVDAFVSAVMNRSLSQSTHRSASSSLNLNIDDYEWIGCLRSLPKALQELLSLAFVMSKGNAKASWPAIVLQWTGRNDLAANQFIGAKATSLPLQSANSDMVGHANGGGGCLIDNSSGNQSSTTSGNASVSTDKQVDGLKEVETNSFLRFPEDDRMHEVCRMLRSSIPLYVKVERAPEDTEVERRQKLQHKLFSLCKRSLASTVGRGMLTLGTVQPLMAEALPIPALSLTGRVPPTNTLIQCEAAQDHLLWIEFHNGVAAALRLGITPSPTIASSSSGNSNTGLGMHRVTRNWILYNKTYSLQQQNNKTNNNSNNNSSSHGENGHAGFLLGLGLLGHLTVFYLPDICDYLTQGLETTTVAVLIGVAASKIGSADSLFSKTLCLHLPSLLPAQHWDIEISPAVQSAALIGLGLLYFRSSHRLIVEFLLEELSRKPSGVDHCEDRECLALTAAWALGMVLLPEDNTSSPPTPTTTTTTSTTTTAAGGSGSNGNGGVEGTNTATTSSSSSSSALQDLSDMRIEDRLLSFLHGGERIIGSKLFSLPDGSNGMGGGGSQGGNSNNSGRSSRILEGEFINTDITSPAACIALSLIFMKSKNIKILKQLLLPQAASVLDSIRPDLLLYRTLAESLIRWDEMLPSITLIEERIPLVIRKSFSSSQTTTSTTTTTTNTNTTTNTKRYQGPYGASKSYIQNLSLSSAFLLYCNSLTGYLVGIGLIYAGSFDLQAKEVIMTKIKWLQSLRDGKGLNQLGFTMERVHKICLEMCLSSLSLALACVMAGSGDLDCLRLFRELRWKVEDVVYGTHMAYSMALGLLFLGGGKYSLRRDTFSIACLMISILPRYPNQAGDQQFHLQALRHFYVLAAEPRVLHTIDIDSMQPVSVDLELELMNGEKVITRAPGLLPELATVRRINVVGGISTSGSGRGSSGIRYYPSSIILKKEGNSSSSNGSKRSEQEVEVEVGEGEEEKKVKIRSNRRVDLSPHSSILAPLYVKRCPDRMKQTDDEGRGSTAEVLDQWMARLFSKKGLEEKREERGRGEEEINDRLVKWLASSPSIMELLMQVLHH